MDPRPPHAGELPGGDYKSLRAAAVRFLHDLFVSRGRAGAEQLSSSTVAVGVKASVWLRTTLMPQLLMRTIRYVFLSMSRITSSSSDNLRIV